MNKNRLIVALDVPTYDEALELVEVLDNVSFFKVGLELFLSGNILGFIQEIQESRVGVGGVFIDLKISGDIGHTIKRFIKSCTAFNVKFVTLSESVASSSTATTIRAARQARGSNDYPRLLMVPLYSSLDADVDFVVDRGRAMLDLGCDGLIVSGQAIKECRAEFPECDIVSPGIRPTWASADDHKQHVTPTEAIMYGSDYLVVGRPIYKAIDPRASAQKIINEIDQVMTVRRS